MNPGLLDSEAPALHSVMVLCAEGRGSRHGRKCLGVKVLISIGWGPFLTHRHHRNRSFLPFLLASLSSVWQKTWGVTGEVGGETGESLWVHSTGTQRERFGKSVFMKHHSVTYSSHVGVMFEGLSGQQRDDKAHSSRTQASGEPLPPSEKARGSGRTRPSLVQVVRLEG